MHSHGLSQRYRERWLINAGAQTCLLILLILLACQRNPENTNSIKIEELLSHIDEMKELVSGEHAMELYESIRTLEENCELIENGLFSEIKDPQWTSSVKPYLEAYHVLSECKTACADLQKEISYIENELLILKDEVDKKLITEKDFDSQFEGETKRVNELKDRINNSLATADYHLRNFRNINPMVEKYKERLLKDQETLSPEPNSR
jgi:hypothetical protein